MGVRGGGPGPVAAPTTFVRFITVLSVIFLYIWCCDGMVLVEGGPREVEHCVGYLWLVETRRAACLTWGPADGSCDAQANAPLDVTAAEPHRGNAGTHLITPLTARLGPKPARLQAVCSSLPYPRTKQHAAHSTFPLSSRPGNGSRRRKKTTNDAPRSAAPRGRDASWGRAMICL